MLSIGIQNPVHDVDSKKSDESAFKLQKDIHTLNEASLTAHITDFVNLHIPLQFPRKSCNRSLAWEPTNINHTSVVAASLLETLTTPFRTRTIQAQGTLGSIVGCDIDLATFCTSA